MNLNHPVTYIKGVSVARAELLYTELGVKTCNDLLHLFPFRYIDKTQFYTINQLKQNTSEVQIVGKITGIKGDVIVSRDTKEGAELFGSPALDKINHIRSMAIVRNLPKVMKRIEKLEESILESSSTK